MFSRKHLQEAVLFRTEFDLPSDYAGKHEWLKFHGVNYRSNLWVNGHKVADSTQMEGAYRLYSFDIAHYAKAGQKNCLALEIYPPASIPHHYLGRLEPCYARQGHKYLVRRNRIFHWPRGLRYMDTFLLITGTQNLSSIPSAGPVANSFLLLKPSGE
jgi:hypothetical protein